MRFAAWFLAIYIISLLATLPASMAGRFIPAQPGLALQGWHGTLWQGGATFKYKQSPPAEIAWHVSPGLTGLQGMLTQPNNQRLAQFALSAGGSAKLEITRRLAVLAGEDAGNGPPDDFIFALEQEIF